MEYDIDQEVAALAATHSNAYLQVRNLTKRYGQTTVLHALSLGVAQGEFISLLGSSGCGKTTLLRLIAGLMEPNDGTITIDGADLTWLAPHKRNVGVVFQNYALFPHLNVAENVAFGLKAKGEKQSVIDAQVAEALALVRMQEFADRPVSALSGGQQQRIAVARALAVKPKLLLLDEPFSALDRNLREAMQIDLRRILRNLGITSIFVTHDQDEALVMSDRIAVMSKGRIEQLGTPAEIYDNPASLYVMEFVGQSCRLNGSVSARDGGFNQITTAAGEIRAPEKFLTGFDAAVCIRPEVIRLGRQEGAEFNNLTLKLRETIYLGSRTMLHLDGGHEEDRFIIELDRLPEGLVLGAMIDVHWPVAATMVYAP